MRNLLAEMARYGVTVHDLSVALNCTDKTITNKINGSTEFSYKEALCIRDAFFKGFRLEYLFADNLDEAS